MRVAVVGSRNFTDFDLMYEVLVLEHGMERWGKLISGGAKGADKMAERIAKDNGFRSSDIIVHYPDWEHHGKAAGFVRNRLIVQDADEVIAFFGPDAYQTKGTLNTVRLAMAARKPVHIYFQNER